ncbi:MAG: hypothetical protein AB1742_13250 [bacterium]
MKKARLYAAAAVCVLVLAAALAAPVHSSKLGDKFVGKILKGAGIALLTAALADQLNDFINTITLNKGVPSHAATKVVPIVALGAGTRVGAAQVTGPKDLVDKTVVVVQVETKFGAKNLDVEVFVPSDSENPLDFNRVEGVGVSALIDLRLSGI